MEPALYEMKPYACVGFGLFAVTLGGLASAFGAVLLGAGCMIIRWRRSYRRIKNVSARR